jgi:hypothetical protein
MTAVHTGMLYVHATKLSLIYAALLVGALLRMFLWTLSDLAHRGCNPTLRKVMMQQRNLSWDGQKDHRRDKNCRELKCGIKRARKGLEEGLEVLKSAVISVMKVTAGWP